MQISDYNCAQKPNSCPIQRRRFYDLQIKLKLVSIWTPTESTNFMSAEMRSDLLTCLRGSINAPFFRKMPNDPIDDDDSSSINAPQRQTHTSSREHSHYWRYFSYAAKKKIEKCESVSTPAWNGTNSKVSCWAFAQSCSALSDWHNQEVLRRREGKDGCYPATFLSPSLALFPFSPVGPFTRGHPAEKCG